MRKNFLLLTLFFIVIIASCNKPDETGLGVQPATDLPGVSILIDSNLITYTVKEDSIVSSSTLSPLFLGSLNDPETGITYSSFYSELRLGAAVTNKTFKGATIDTVVLRLGLVKDVIYGNPKKMHHISVYQLAESLSKDSIYYSTHSFAVGQAVNDDPRLALIGHVDVIPEIGLHEISGIDQPRLVIPIDTAFGRYLMHQFNSRSTTDNVTLLTSILKGIYVVDSVDGTGSIINVLPTSLLNKMVISYRDSILTNKTFELYLNSNCARSLRFKHDYCNSSAVSQQVCNTSGGNVNHDTVYVQSLAGLKTKVIMPDWNQVFNNKKVSINRADLIFSVKPGTDSEPYKAHESFYLLAADSTGKNTTTYDFGDIGGTYNSTTKEYKLNLTQHLQRILNGNVKDYGLYISTGVPLSTTSGVLIIPSNARRTVLNGGTSMKISITYTQQKD